MKTLISILALSLTLFAQSQTAGTQAGATVTAPTPPLTVQASPVQAHQPVNNGSTAAFNVNTPPAQASGAVQGSQQISTTLSTGSPPNNNAANQNARRHNQNGMLATNGLNGQVGLANPFGTNLSATGTGTVDVGAVGVQLVTLQANVEQTLSVLASLNARVINNNNGVGLGAAANANGRSLTASGNASATFPPASASGQFLPPTGNTTGTTVPPGNPSRTGPATASGSTSIGTDARTFELLVRLQNNLRQSDMILQNLNGSFSANGVNANGTLNGNVGRSGFVDRFTVSTNR